MSPDPSGDEPERAEGWRGIHSRRVFLRRGTITGAAVALVGSFPGLSGLVSTAVADAPAVEPEAAAVTGDAGAVSLAQPLLAHVKDLGTGEISLFQGEREVIFHDPALARRLLSAIQH
jgi:uncharacterized membrane protein YbjE (DUF340 family)